MSKTRIMWLERKAGLAGPARIGRITFSKSGQSVHMIKRAKAAIGVSQ